MSTRQDKALLDIRVMAIVNTLFEMAGLDVDTRQSLNDKADNAVKEWMADLHKDINVGLRKSSVKASNVSSYTEKARFNNASRLAGLKEANDIIDRFFPQDNE